ncbi:MAG TPA: arylsulfatase, partial [Methylomirabilota bacterium]|nr:arylsulfatase [Methylomirabilota bacterium]
TPLRLPKLVNLRMDPFEKADVSSINYWQWRIERVFAIAPVGALIAQWLQSFMEFPPRQTPDSWSPEGMIEKLKANANAAARAASPD